MKDNKLFHKTMIEKIKKSYAEITQKWHCKELTDEQAEAEIKELGIRLRWHQTMLEMFFNCA